MSPLFLAIAAACAAFVGGGLLGRVIRMGAGERERAAALSAAHEAKIAAETEAEAFRRDVAEPARAEIAQTREALQLRREKLDARATELKERKARTREKIEVAQTRLKKETTRLTQKETALSAATEAFDVLTAEARARQEEASTLKTQIRQLATTAGRRQQEIATREQEIADLHDRVTAQSERLDALVDEHLSKLERVASMSREEARRQLVDEMVREAKLEAAGRVKDARDEARRIAQREAQKVILKSIQRLAATTTIEHTVAPVLLTSDDQKGRIIGREGRNIRAFEAATGVEVVVDDTPDAVLVSSFDPVRREVARLSLSRLLADGRVHPARIEEIVEATREEIDEEIVQTGEQTALELQLHGLHPELVRLVGRMKYRSSYGQNLLAHSIETAKLASLMAAELDLDARKARRAGLLHDIGKVMEEDLEVPHAIAGMEVARRLQEHPDVANAIGAHHDEVPMATPIAALVQAADAASGARPGARRESLERYVERLKTLETLASTFDGVAQAYAIQAGREIRVVVDTRRVSDALAETLAVDISRQIERDMDYPGQIKVTVIREVRATATAR
ncbi:MAG: ribonuclease Y [Rubricoccaceae bacterium]